MTSLSDLPHSIFNPPIVFVCGPYHAENASGQMRNIQLAKEAALLIASEGFFPLTPHMNTMFFDTMVPFQYPEKPYTEDLFIDGYLRLLPAASVLYVIGDRITEGMQGEINLARELHIPIVHTIPDLKKAIETLEKEQ